MMPETIYPVGTRIEFRSIGTYYSQMKQGMVISCSEEGKSIEILIPNYLNSKEAEEERKKSSRKQEIFKLFTMIAFMAICSISAFYLLFSVDWRIAAGVFMAAWSLNSEREINRLLRRVRRSK